MKKARFRGLFCIDTNFSGGAWGLNFTTGRADNNQPHPKRSAGWLRGGRGNVSGGGQPVAGIEGAAHAQRQG